MNASSQAALIERLKRAGETADQTLTRVLEDALSIKTIDDWITETGGEVSAFPSPNVEGMVEIKVRDKWRQAYSVGATGADARHFTAESLQRWERCER